MNQFVRRAGLGLGIALMMIPTLYAAPPAAPAVPSLRVGTGKVDITPPLLPMANGIPETLGSHLYVRAIVLDNGVTRAALLNADQGGVRDPVWADASQRIAALLNCPQQNIIISAIHTHSDGGTFSRDLMGANRNQPQAKMPSVADALVAAARQAYSHLQPAKVGFGTQALYLNANRDAISPITHRWYQGPNLNAPSDKTVAVVTFESPAGQPLAIYYNYAMHPIDFYLTGVVSADFPGAASADLEAMYPGSVAVFTQGASGDQNPLYLLPRLQVLEALHGQPVTNETIAEQQSQSNKFPGLKSWDPSRAPKVKAQEAKLTAWVNAEGQMLGQAVLRAIRHTSEFRSDVAITAGQKTVTCPGRTRLDNARQGVAGSYKPGPAVPIRVGLLRIGGIAIGRADAELYTAIAERFKAESPVRDTMMVTLSDGAAPSGYIYSDAAYTHQSFQVLSSRLEPGCAESGIVNGILGLMGAPGN